MELIGIDNYMEKMKDIPFLEMNGGGTVETLYRKNRYLEHFDNRDNETKINHFLKNEIVLYIQDGVK